MRKSAPLALPELCMAMPARGDETTRGRVAAFFTGWYSICPSANVTAVESSEVAIPGYRARDRILRNIDPALRLGLNGTPVFFGGCAFLTSKPNLAEGYIQERRRSAGRSGGTAHP